MFKRTYLSIANTDETNTKIPALLYNIQTLMREQKLKVKREHGWEYADKC